MLKINLQFFGGRGMTGSRVSGSSIYETVRTVNGRSL